MKKAAFFILIMILFLGCKKNTETKLALNESISSQMVNSSTSDNDMNSSKNTNFKVTFIELGSVRCIPCKMMQPVMKKVQEQFKGQVNVVFYDIWTEKDAPMAEKYKIQVIPTQVFLDNKGEEFFRHGGYFPYEELEKVLKDKGVK